VEVILFLFFFSSRRRHTRFSRDWSSDVCSSDLVEDTQARASTARCYTCRVATERELKFSTSDDHIPSVPELSLALEGSGLQVARSEERRVGKECRCRRTQQHEIDNTRT